VDDTPPSGGVKSLGAKWGGSGGAAGGVRPGVVTMDLPGGGSPGSGKKLTWSERQAEAKRQREEEDRGSQDGEI
jgi:hypothetical protein